MDPARLIAWAVAPDPDRNGWALEKEVWGRRLLVVAIGKAARRMAEGAVAALGPQVAGLEVGGGAHPVPDAESERFGRHLLRLVAEADVDRILLLISGGASAMVAVPADGLTLADKAATVSALMRAGVAIGDLNCVRKHLSAIKGGRLAAAARAPMATLALSDVIGDDLATVGSGPGVPDPSTFEQAWTVIQTRTVWTAVPAAVRRHLEAGRAGHISETPKTPRPEDQRVLVAGLGTLVQTARNQIGTDRAELLGAELAGDVVPLAQRLAAVARRLAGTGRYAIGAGEPTVVVPAGAGRSGRAAQLALLVARAIDGVDAQVLCAGTDGIDGTGEAAGAVVDGATWRALAAAGIDGERALVRCDAAAALAAVGAAVVTGPTGVNHADLLIVCGRQTG